MNKGYHPNITIHPECDLSSTHTQDFAVDLNELHEFLQETMSEAQKQYQQYVDTKQLLAPEFPLSSSKQNTSKPPGPLRNYLKRI